MPNIRVWHRVEAQQVFLFVYVQTGIGNYAYRYRYRFGATGLEEQAVYDMVNAIGAGLHDNQVEGLF